MGKINSKYYQDLIGIKFKYTGRTKEEGLDCLGLLYILCSRLNIDMPHQASVIDRKLRAVALEEGKKMFVEIDKAEPGCFVGFRVGSFLNHIGMMVDSVRFIHIVRSKTVCIEKINSLVWSGRLENFYKFREKENNE